MDRRVSGGRNNGRICEGEEFALLCQILCPIEVGEEEEGSAKEELEELGGEALLKELPELSQHEELQDLELHGSKTVRPSLQGDSREGGAGGEINPCLRIVMVEPDVNAEH